MAKKLTKFKQANSNLRPPKAGRMRHIKAEYAIHEVVNEMSINARYAETYTWCYADIHGRFEWKPKTLKLHILPFDNIEFEPLSLGTPPRIVCRLSAPTRAFVSRWPFER